jgi:hypothetical protein
MDKLNNINRETGYLVCAETLEALASIPRYFEGFLYMDRQLSPSIYSTAIILNTFKTQLFEVIIFADGTMQSCALRNMTGQVISNDILIRSNGTYSIVYKQEAITVVDGSGYGFPDSIRRHIAEIVLADNNHPAYKFITPREAILGRWDESLLLNDNSSFAAKSGFIRYNKILKSLEIQLVLNHNVSFVSPVSMQIMSNESIPLPNRPIPITILTRTYSNSNYVPCASYVYLSGGNLHVYLGYGDTVGGDTTLLNGKISW